MIEYNGYTGTVEADIEANNLWGKIVGIEDDIFYEGETLGELRQSMAEAIDNYIEHCHEIGKNPQTVFSGKIALRVDPRMHATVAAAAEETGRSMNQVIVDALNQHVASSVRMHRLNEIPMMKLEVDDPVTSVRATLRGKRNAPRH